MDKNLYEILNIKTNATIEEIKHAYRQLAIKYHPDINKTKEGLAYFKEIQNAYNILSNDSKRKKYDKTNGFNIKEETAEEEIDTTEDGSNGETEFQDRYKASTQEKSERSKFSKIISEFFDEILIQTKRVQFSKKRGYKESNDIYADVTISPKEALFGTQRIVNVVQATTCPNCNGKKFINEAKCRNCNSTGEIYTHKKINVTIPANTKNGKRIKIEKCGNKDIETNTYGDLYLIISINEQSLFTIKENTVYLELPITAYEAALGAKIKIPTFYEDITIKIPPCTSSGQKFRLKGQGIYNKEKGQNEDMIVTISIKFPQEISKKEIALYEELKENSGYNVREGLINNDE